MKLRPFHFRLRSFAAAGFATLLALAGGAFLSTTPASAVADGVTALGSFSVGTLNPPFSTGTTNQAASSISFSIPSAVTNGDTISIQVQPHSSANCSKSPTDFIGFNAAPVTVVIAGVGLTLTPTLSTVASDPGSCAGVNDLLTLTASSATGTGPFTVTISGIAYNVGATADPGTIAVGIFSTTTTPTTTTFFAINTGITTPPSDASVAGNGATATANSPAVIVTNNGATGTVSNIVVTESTLGAVNHTLCIVPDTAASSPTAFSFTTPGTVTVGGGGAVAGTPVLSGGAISIPITTPSTTATTYTIAGAVVATSGAVTGPAAVNIVTGNSTCGTDLSGITAGLVAFGIAPTLNTAISGSDADGTAIAEMAAGLASTSGCPVGNAVVLATDQNFPDALAASYLAGFLHTGILLTPTAGLSAETQAALQNFGITKVYVVGGLLAISQNTINQVNATPAYTCGGPASGTKTGSNIAVFQTLAGTTEYDTAQQIATLPGSGNVHSINLSGAYLNQYNGTTGTESSSPSAVGALRTAVVASGASYQDASSASVLAYNNQFPLVLTDPNSLSSQAQTTLQSLGITQAIVLGGPLAVSNADVTSIIGLGISVIRIGGQDATDTSQDLASFELQSTAKNAGLGWSSTWHNQILVARGDFYSDALAGCVLAVLHTTPLLLTESPTNVGQYLTGFLNQGGNAAGILGLGTAGNIQSIQPLGGPIALFFSTLQAMAAAVAAG